MEIFTQYLPQAERISLQLCQEYAQFGYRRYRCRRPEEYALYQENRNFLGQRQLLSFVDVDGCLRALKPDITLGIARRTQATCAQPERVYYTETVYRFSQSAGRMEEQRQLGLEYLGAVDDYATLEVLALAARSLQAVDESGIFTVSHTGVVSGLLAQAGELLEPVRDAILSAIRAKSPHDVTAQAQAAGLSPAMCGALALCAGLQGNPQEVLERARQERFPREAVAALEELCVLCERLRRAVPGCTPMVDLSMLNDLGYYSGVIFQGYISKAPSPVLAGGRYDPLLRRLHREIGAVGFALFLDLLPEKGALPAPQRLEYRPGDDPVALFCECVRRTQEGACVCVVEEEER